MARPARPAHPWAPQWSPPKGPARLTSTTGEAKPMSDSPPSAASLRQSILRKSRESADLKNEFFSARADLIVECSHTMVRAFDAGARLLVFGNGGSLCDAQHVAVEFMHPVVEKRKPLPALVLAAD